MRGARLVGAMCVAWMALAGAAAGAASGATAGAAARAGAGAVARPAPRVALRVWPSGHPNALRLGRALGLIPRREVPGNPREPVVFHGGAVMHGTRIHLVFWVPAGYAFTGPPQPGTPGFTSLVESFFADAARDSGRHDSIFSAAAEYGDAAGPGTEALAFTPATDTVRDTAPYPPLRRQCASPAGVSACLTDAELESELRRVVAGHLPGTGLHDLWFVFLPPGVDECLSAGQCGTSAFAGYHSVFATAQGPVVYAVVVDPIVEGVALPGADPQGNPEAEAALDVAAHETLEAVTDPVGTGWMDPDGGEVGDKCTTAYGAPIGFAGNGSPYNQVLNGHPYLLQEMWSNVASGCAQAAAPAAAPQLPTLALDQFSPRVRGASGRPGRRVSVTVALVRGGQLAALARTVTDRLGAWGVTLRTLLGGSPVGLGDDRDVLLVRYGAGGPAPETVATGDGGDPFTEAGFTGWYALDHGFVVRRDSVEISPCGQTGVIALKAGRTVTTSAMELCSPADDTATVPTGRLAAGTPVRLASTDNRGANPSDPAGVLVRLAVAPGEPGSLGVGGGAGDPTLPQPSGLPACAAELSSGRVRCHGLVARATYTLARQRTGARARVLSARAASDGIARFGLGAGGARGGDRLVLRRVGGRVLTTLHVARLRVDLPAGAGAVRAGVCQPGEMWGPALSEAPSGSGTGVAGTGDACPLDGGAGGLPGRDAEQIDSLSGGLTVAGVPALAAISPASGATLYGGFIAVARVTGPGAVAARVAVVITRHGHRGAVRRATGAGAAQGVRIGGLPAGVYDAVWTVRDANGDTRTLRSWFVEEP